MKDEIKEILEALKPHNDIVKEYPLTLSIEEQKLLLDYITNLQDRIYKAIEYMKTLYDEYADNDYDIKCNVFNKLYYEILQGKSDE